MEYSRPTSVRPSFAELKDGSAPLRWPSMPSPAARVAGRYSVRSCSTARFAARGISSVVATVRMINGGPYARHDGPSPTTRPQRTAWRTAMENWIAKGAGACAVIGILIGLGARSRVRQRRPSASPSVSYSAEVPASQSEGRPATGLTTTSRRPECSPVWPGVTLRRQAQLFVRRAPPPATAPPSGGE